MMHAMPAFRVWAHGGVNQLLLRAVGELDKAIGAGNLMCRGATIARVRPQTVPSRPCGRKRISSSSTTP
jgi:hypothetical protein